ncbi:hypothetical protein HK104_008863, partial [Borealophlyctis nickersoniae]
MHLLLAVVHLLLIAVNVVKAGPNTLDNVAAKLRENQIFGDVIPEFTPTVLLNVAYPAGNVELGNTLTVAETADAPTVKYTAPNEADFFSLVMVDP